MKLERTEQPTTIVKEDKTKDGKDEVKKEDGDSKDDSQKKKTTQVHTLNEVHPLPEVVGHESILQPVHTTGHGRRVPRRHFSQIGEQSSHSPNHLTFIILPEVVQPIIDFIPNPNSLSILYPTPLIPKVEKPSQPQNNQPDGSNQGSSGQAKPNQPDSSQDNPKPQNPTQPEEPNEEKFSENHVMLLDGVANKGFITAKAEDFTLKKEILFLMKGTGENLGVPNEVVWTGKDLEAVEARKPGKYELIVETKEDYVLQEENYGKVKLKVIIELTK